MKKLIALGCLCISLQAVAQQRITGTLYDARNAAPLAFSTVVLQGTNTGATADEQGKFELMLPEQTEQGNFIISFVGYNTDTIALKPNTNHYTLYLKPEKGTLQEVVVTGTMKEVSRLNSPIPVEIITPKFFQKNPTPSLFEAVGMINGVQSQLNCAVCNTGDIHINGMEGPYTMVLIDGMPIVSSLSTVYGLSGIPNSIVERIEVVKGPASSLYGSEAMGGIINVITKKPENAPLLSFDFFGTSWQEYSADASVKWKAGSTQSLLGVNYFNYNQPFDKNNDDFTDVTLQNRISVFNKWSLDRKDNRIVSIAGRYVYEDRWGGQTNWNKQWRGTDSIYGESIYTNRYEVIAMYQLPTKEKIMTQWSYNYHDQNSYYGTTPYMANQQTAFAQMYWDKQLGERHNFLLGSTYRYTLYDDNTPGTADVNGSNKPIRTPLPGVFVQDEWTISKKHTLLGGYRYDYDKNHGNIHSPRVAYKWSANEHNTVRTSMGTGYRVVNLFTEDHAALTGAREVVITEALRPERSYNGNLNYVLQIPRDAYYLSFDVTGFYSYFTNKITGDFDIDPDKIIYDNLKGHAISRGVSLNTELTLNVPLKIMAGVTYMDVYQVEEDGQGGTIKTQQMYAPNWSGNFVTSYTVAKHALTIDLTGKWNGPMRLPILPNDYRPEYSPWYMIANVQVTKKFRKGLEIYGGVKNLFNFVPEDPILRPWDPFDKHVDDPVNNPYNYTFDPSYNYASMQGIRGFLGVRYMLRDR